jgi:hypothetical protein
MYANTDNPPPIDAPIQTAAPHIETAVHLYSLSRLSRLLLLICRAQERVEYSRHRYDSHSLISSPFVSRGRWEEDIRRWSYITRRLERYYLRKVCELNSMTYRAVAETTDDGRQTTVLPSSVVCRPSSIR